MDNITNNYKCEHPGYHHLSEEIECNLHLKSTCVLHHGHKPFPK